MTNYDELLDPGLRASLDQVPPQTTWNPALMRAQGETVVDHSTQFDGVDVTVHELSTDEGGLEVRVMTPQGSTPTALVMSIHGGGFVAGRASYDDAWNAQVAQKTGAVVVSPDYRLAPEAPYPAGLDDCQAAWHWAVRTFRPSVTVLYGDSAGGCLAAALALRLTDTQAPDSPNSLFLIEPVLDDRLETPSMVDGTATPVWDHANARASWAAYLGASEAGTSGSQRYAAPGRNVDLQRMPPTFILANQCDPLRDEDICFARNLTNANVATELLLLARTCHGLLGFQDVPVADRAKNIVLNRLAEATRQATGRDDSR
ncbi:alpha/beta hydrolase fold domain-containing protein [Cutibacterium sp.]|uniref:alpha/beta hydrolase fold domain-containing protein n=1 Tax=Cutibacterium sp. TaxID=1912221 RepID=UPI0026DCB565|nr:alpha/beta hydrolase fold domain-containing protein [Cutibacterium sp.]MDO4412950.1 alpha/beta hydrolase fold domain-containing protein [Cutibacterium sp.]